MSTLQHYKTPSGLVPAVGYSHVIAGSGRSVVVAGQVAVSESGEPVGIGDSEAQIRQVFRNLELALTCAGASFADVVKLNYYLTDISLLPLLRSIRDEFVNTARPPASTGVQVASLVRPEFVVEIDAWALCD